MLIGIGIPVTNNWEKYTKPMLDSIKSKHDLYVCFVDNRSPDNTREEATKLITDKFHYKRNEEVWGVSKSWNYCMQDCFVNRGCKYVLILNNDVILNPHAIDNLVERFETLPWQNEVSSIDDIKEFGDWAKDSDGDPWRPGGRADDHLISNIVMATCMNVKGECDDLGGANKILELNPEDKKAVEESENPDFSGFMVNKRCMDEVGLFDEEYKYCYEDNDYHRRIKLAGLKAIKVPTALFYHYGGGSISVFAKAKFDISKAYFEKKWGGLPEPDGSIGDRLWKKPFNV